MIADTIRAVQRGLIAQGFSVGKSGADGVLGKQTRAALTAYQKANGLHPSGQANSATIAALLQPATPKPNLRPQQVGQMTNSPFASRSTEAPPPPSPGGQVAGSVSPSQSGSPPPTSFGQAAGDVVQELLGVKPAQGAESYGNRGRPNGTSSAGALLDMLVPGPSAPPYHPEYGRSMMPPGQSSMPPEMTRNPIPPTAPPMPMTFNPPPVQEPPAPQGDAAIQDVIRQAIEEAIWKMMLGARVQPQPNRPAYSDDFSTATQPPAFTSPMGQYR